MSYGHTKEIRLCLGEEFEIVEKLKAYEKPWITVPESDIIRTAQEAPIDHLPVLDIKLNAPILKDKVNLIIPPDCSSDTLSEVLIKSLDNVLPVIVYIINDESLSDEVRNFVIFSCCITITSNSSMFKKSVGSRKRTLTCQFYS